MKDLNEVFLHFLQDMYYAGRWVMKTMPKLAKAAQNKDLRNMSSQSREEKPQHTEQVQHMFELVGKRARGRGMRGDQRPERGGGGTAGRGQGADPGPRRMPDCLRPGDGALRHGPLRHHGRLAKANGNEDAAQILQQMLNANKNADQHLNELANTTLNPQAASGEEGAKPVKTSKKSDERKPPIPVGINDTSVRARWRSSGPG